MPVPYLPSALPTPPSSGLASPATAKPQGIPGPDTQSFMASPMADRISGVMMQQQEQAKFAKIAQLVQQGLRLLEGHKAMTDPKSAVKLGKVASELHAMFPQQAGAPGPQGAQQMAGQVPQPPGGPQGSQQGFPPPPVPGTGSMPGGGMMMGG